MYNPKAIKNSTLPEGFINTQGHKNTAYVITATSYKVPESVVVVYRYRRQHWIVGIISILILIFFLCYFIIVLNHVHTKSIDITSKIILSKDFN